MKFPKDIQPVRIKKITKVISGKKFVTVEDLCDLIDASPSTIRRDLRTLEEKGVIDRFHGGAVIQRKISVPFSEREKENLEEKNKIARKAIEIIKDNNIVILDAGTTVMMVARQLGKMSKKALTIITPAINIAQLLLGKTEIKIILSGGLLSTKSNSLLGVLSIEAFKKLMADIAIMSCEAISPSLEIMYSDLEIIQVKRAIMNSATYRVLIADSSKFGKFSLASFGEIDLFDMVITDNKLSDKYINEIKKRNLKLVIAE